MSKRSAQKITISSFDHPHNGESGHIGIKDNGKVSTIKAGKSIMIEIWLENCVHGVTTTYVKQADMVLVP